AQPPAVRGQGVHAGAAARSVARARAAARVREVLVLRRVPAPVKIHYGAHRARGGDDLAAAGAGARGGSVSRRADAATVRARAAGPVRVSPVACVQITGGHLDVRAHGAAADDWDKVWGQVARAKRLGGAESASRSS